MSGLERRNPGEPEFQQAVHEVAQSLMTDIHSTCVEYGTEYGRGDRVD